MSIRPWLSSLVLVSACGKDAAAPAPAPTPTAPPTAASAPAAPASAATTPELPALEEIPPLDLTPADRKRMATSSKLNGEGLELHRKGDYPGAITKYKEALAADPGNLLARYNLACAWNLSGDAPRGLAVLRQLRSNGCRACLAQLIQSRSDKDWDSQRSNPQYDLITKDVAVEPADLAKLAEEVAKFDGKLTTLEPYIHPRSPVKIVVGGTTEWSFTGAAELARWEAEANEKGNPDLRRAIKVKCKDLCCVFLEREEPPADTTLYLDKVCFEKRGDAPFLARIEFADFRQSRDDMP